MRAARARAAPLQAGAARNGGAARWERRAAATLALTAVLLLGAGPMAAGDGRALRAQSIADRVAASPDGTVRLRFAARPGVCGSKHGGVIIQRHDGDAHEHDDCACNHGPVRVRLRVKDGRVRAVDTEIGGRPPATDARATDLGRVPAAAAADYFVALAAEVDAAAAKDAILPAVIADSATVWPGLLEIAKDRSRPPEARKTALFWVGQAAATAATQGLERIAWSDDDREVREHAVFALSRRPDDEAVPTLIRLARESPDAGIREKALFWLARIEDPRVLALFEELLTGG